MCFRFDNKQQSLQCQVPPPPQLPKNKTNKRPMGHIAHLRNQFKSMNTFERSYDNMYYKTGTVVQEEKILKFRECTFAILSSFSHVKRCGLVVLEMIFQIC